MISISGYDTKYKNSDKAFNGIEKKKDGTITKKQKGALKQNMKKGDKLTIYLLFYINFNKKLFLSKVMLKVLYIKVFSDCNIKALK